MQEQSRKYLRAVVILAAGVAAAWLIIVSKPPPEPEPYHEPQPHLADIISVTLESRPIEVSSQGTIAPRTEIDVTSQVSGEVVSVSEHFAAGGFFAEDEVLLQLDPSDYEIALARAEATLAEARKVLAQEEGQALQARKEWRDLGSQAADDLFLRKPQMAAAEANVRAAEAGVRKAKLDLERTRISLPFDGRVISVSANLGQYINSGATLGSVYALNPMEVRLPLTATELGLLNLRATTETHELSPLQVDLYFSAGPNEYHWPARAVRLEASVDSRSRLFHLVAQIDNAADLFESDPAGGVTGILPGTFVEATIASNPHEGVVTLPRSALFQQSQVLYLDEDNRLQTQQVTVLQLDSRSLVVKGLSDRQQVLAKPPSFLALGEVYTPVSADGIAGGQ